MYTIRFPVRLKPKLEPIFAEQELMERVTWGGDQIVVQLNESQAVALKLRLIECRIGPMGGWKREHDGDHPQTQPPSGMDFS